MAKKKAVILGSSGMIGQRFVHMLNNHPYFDVVAYCASDRSEGKKLEDVWKLSDLEIDPRLANEVIQATEASALINEGVDVAFSGLPSEVAGPIEDDLAEAGIAVFSNAASHRMEPDTPILIPEINSDHLASVDVQKRRRKKGGFVVTNANCSVTGLALGLKPLIDKFGFSEVDVATYQALSGAGYPGVSSLDITGNVLPLIKNEEEKMGVEGKKILGAWKNGRFVDSPVNIMASCARVHVRDGHLEAVFIRDRAIPDAKAIAKALRDFRAKPQTLKLPTAPEQPIIVMDEPNRPQPLLDAYAGTPDRARGMATVVGRIRVTEGCLRFYLLSHNTIRGGAGGSVLNAELAFKEGVI
ncbi:MAG: aspartate-semialdehyde dehydrogenase [Euryarchaeota archaeon RBG_19FT_COMBO_56_21]|nr:MAG: aspartate-semialdehyde dehydrogenase [Euryarchaeota archaeon RBG_19FT_COMBO_56_21]